ncbi:MAG: NAD(+)/NADH kinase [Candidatus Diapherotrites archaeon]|uniref:NAD kinase n=1 Tax=Candidatus Iainarchaeum sp. TaxID=3101447 RepID=A0A8T4L764_9ARCH|nr:NAD(+)/NADH kinase [Candidatus Diapherotrites archaeon]
MPVPHAVGIVGNYANNLAKKRALHALRLLEKAGLTCMVDRSFSLVKKAVDIDEFQVDLTLVFGGDGTMLYAARHTKNKSPLLGVNCGEKGYLMDWNFRDFDKDSPDILQGKFRVEERTRLQALSPRNVPLALNEYLLVPKQPGHYMEFDLYVNGKRVWNEASDGVLVATPTGSTGHALSAWGPHILPTTKALEIVSMNSMDRARRPLVVEDHAKIELKNFHELWGCELIADGQRRTAVDNDLTILKGKPIYFAKRFEERKAHPAEARDLSPSAKFLVKLLEVRGELTQKELIQETGLPGRTVRRALDGLIGHGLVLQATHAADARKTLYSLA